MVRYPINPMSRTENHGPWHYVDYPYVLDDTKAPAVDETWDGKSVPANLLQAMDKAITELKDPATPPDRKAIDLCWVEHLVGDIHQPLHAVSMFSKEFPTGDRGGNSLMVKASNGNINLHAFWDDAAGLSLDPDVIRKSADQFEKDHPADSLKDKVADLKVTDWAQESLALAKEKVYLNGTIPHASSQAGQNDPNSVPHFPMVTKKTPPRSPISASPWPATAWRQCWKKSPNRSREASLFPSPSTLGEGRGEGRILIEMKRAGERIQTVNILLGRQVLYH